MKPFCPGNPLERYSSRREFLYVGLLGGLGLTLDAVIPPGSVPYQLSASRIVTSVVLLLFAAIVGSAFSLRRILKIDPASAIGSTT